jgi:catechol 2,3-dioxygenase-like lactoylglutathione lyase family enzyme
MAMSVMPNLYTADVERATAFYRDLLGGTETFRTPPDGPASHVELRIGDVTIALSSRDAVGAEGLPARSSHGARHLVRVDR